MDSARQAWSDRQDAQMRHIIRTHGWFIQYVGGGECSAPGCDCPDDGEAPFAYTVGLFGLGHSELLILGVDPPTAQGVLNELGERIRAGEALLPGQMITFEKWPHRIVPEEVPNPGEIVFEANRFYRRPDAASVPVLQLSYDDLDGRFPWEKDYVTPHLQPRPGTFKA